MPIVSNLDKKISWHEAWQPNWLHCNRNSSPRNKVFGAHNWNTHKSTPDKHVKQEWCETNVKYLRKWLKTWTMIYIVAQNDLEIGPLRPIFNTSPKVAQIDMYTKIDAEPGLNKYYGKDSALTNNPTHTIYEKDLPVN